MQILMDNAEKAKAIDGYAVSVYLNKYNIPYGRSWTYLHRVIVATLHNPQEMKASTIYRIVARELGKTPITIENGIRNIMKKSGLLTEFTPKTFIGIVCEDIVLGTDSPMMEMFKKPMPMGEATFTKTFTFND